MFGSTDPRQTITKTETGKFLIEWEGRNGKLNLNFTAWLKQASLPSKCCLLHWQAMPKGFRRFGVYERQSDDYLSFIPPEVEILVNPVPLQIDEISISVLPSAVLAFPNSKLIQLSDKKYQVIPV